MLNSSVLRISPKSVTCMHGASMQHPIKYGTEIYLNLIFRRMRTGMQWNEFQKLNIIGPEYSGICKKQGKWLHPHHWGCKWVKYGVFKEFWKRCIIFYSKRKGIQWNSLLVDASYVKNIRGCMVASDHAGGRNLLGRNPTDRGRNSSKISALTDKRGAASPRRACRRTVINYYRKGAAWSPPTMQGECSWFKIISNNSW